MLNQFICKLSLGIFLLSHCILQDSLSLPWYNQRYSQGTGCWWNCDGRHGGLGSLIMQLAVPSGPADAQAWIYIFILWWISDKPLWPYNLEGSLGSRSCCIVWDALWLWCSMLNHSSSLPWLRNTLRGILQKVSMFLYCRWTVKPWSLHSPSPTWACRKLYPTSLFHHWFLHPHDACQIRGPKWQSTAF